MVGGKEEMLVRRGEFRKSPLTLTLSLTEEPFRKASKQERQRAKEDRESEKTVFVILTFGFKSANKRDKEKEREKEAAKATTAHYVPANPRT